MRRDSWLPLMNDDDHVNVLIPIMALAYEHHPDPVMRPYKEPFSIERREKLIVGVAASVRRSTATFPGAENLKLKSSHLLEPSDAMPRKLFKKQSRRPALPCARRFRIAWRHPET